MQAPLLNLARTSTSPSDFIKKSHSSDVPIHSPNNLKKKPLYNNIWRAAFHNLQRLGIVDQNCALTRDYADIMPPDMSDQDFARITKFIKNSPVIIRFKNAQATQLNNQGDVFTAVIPLKQFLTDWLRISKTSSYLRIQEISIVGGAVANLMEWNYLERSLELLLERYNVLNKKTLEIHDLVPITLIEIVKGELSQAPLDIDLRIQMPFLNEEWRDWLKATMVHYVATKTNETQANSNKQGPWSSVELAKAFAFEDLGVIRDKTNPGLVVSVTDRNPNQETRYDFLFYKEINRMHLFGRDALRIKIFDFKWGWSNPQLCSDYNNGWQFILSRCTRALDLDSPETVNKQGWKILQSLCIRGYFPLNPELDQTLLKTTVAGVSPFSERGYYFAHEVTADTLLKHHSMHPYDALILILNDYLHLKLVLLPEEMVHYQKQTIHLLGKLSGQFSSIRNRSEILDFLFKQIIENNVGLDECISDLQLLAFLEMSRPSNRTKSIILDWNIVQDRQPLLELVFKISGKEKYFLIIPFKPETCFAFIRENTVLTQVQDKVRLDHPFEEKDYFAYREFWIGISLNNKAIEDNVEAILKSEESAKLIIAMEFLFALELIHSSTAHLRALIINFPRFLKALNTSMQQKEAFKRFEACLGHSLWNQATSIIKTYEDHFFNEESPRENEIISWIQGLVDSQDPNLAQCVYILWKTLSDTQKIALCPNIIPIFLNVSPVIAVRMWKDIFTQLSYSNYEQLLILLYSHLQNDPLSNGLKKELPTDFPKNESELSENIIRKGDTSTQELSILSFEVLFNAGLIEGAFDYLSLLTLSPEWRNNPLEILNCWLLFPKPYHLLNEKSSTELRIALLGIIYEAVKQKKCPECSLFVQTCLHLSGSVPQTLEMAPFYFGILFAIDFPTTFRHSSTYMKALSYLSSILVEHADVNKSVTKDFRSKLRAQFSETLELLHHQAAYRIVLEFSRFMKMRGFIEEIQISDKILILQSLVELQDSPQDVLTYEPWMYKMVRRNELDHTIEPFTQAKVVIHFICQSDSDHGSEWFNHYKRLEKDLDFSQKLTLHTLILENQTFAVLKPWNALTKNLMKHLIIFPFAPVKSLLNRCLVLAENCVKNKNFESAAYYLLLCQEMIVWRNDQKVDVAQLIEKIIEGLSPTPEHLALLIDLFHFFPSNSPTVWLIFSKALEQSKDVECIDRAWLIFEERLEGTFSKEINEHSRKEFLTILINRMIGLQSFHLLKILKKSAFIEELFDNTTVIFRQILPRIFNACFQTMSKQPDKTKEFIVPLNNWFEWMITLRIVNFETYSSRDLQIDMQMIRFINASDEEGLIKIGLKIAQRMFGRQEFFVNAKVKCESVQTLLTNASTKQNSVSDVNSQFVFLNSLFKNTIPTSILNIVLVSMRGSTCPQIISLLFQLVQQMLKQKSDVKFVLPKAEHVTQLIATSLKTEDLNLLQEIGNCLKISSKMGIFNEKDKVTLLATYLNELNLWYSENTTHENCLKYFKIASDNLGEIVAFKNDLAHVKVLIQLLCEQLTRFNDIIQFEANLSIFLQHLVKHSIQIFPNSKTKYFLNPVQVPFDKSYQCVVHGKKSEMCKTLLITCANPSSEKNKDDAEETVFNIISMVIDVLLVCNADSVKTTAYVLDFISHNIRQFIDIYPSRIDILSSLIDKFVFSIVIHRNPLCERHVLVVNEFLDKALDVKIYESHKEKFFEFAVWLNLPAYYSFGTDPVKSAEAILKIMGRYALAIEPKQVEVCLSAGLKLIARHQKMYLSTHHETRNQCYEFLFQLFLKAPYTKIETGNIYDMIGLLILNEGGFVLSETPLAIETSIKCSRDFVSALIQVSKIFIHDFEQKRCDLFVYMVFFMRRIIERKGYEHHLDEFWLNFTTVLTTTIHFATLSPKTTLSLTKMVTGCFEVPAPKGNHRDKVKLMNLFISSLLQLNKPDNEAHARLVINICLEMGLYKNDQDLLDTIIRKLPSFYNLE